MNSIYNKQPLKVQDNIPIFSNTNAYIENYEDIGKDVLEAIRKTGHNPFMEDSYWKELEDTTLILINKYAKQGDKILDVGVGLGRLLSQLPTLEKYGMDISFDQVKISKEKGIEACLAMVEDMPYNESIFDLVVCTDVLEHVLDINLALKKILYTLKPNGYFIIRVPYKENLSPYLAKDYPYKFAHIRNFDEYTLELLLNRVFDCKLLEFNTAGYSAMYLKFKYFHNFPFFYKVGVFAIELTKRISKKLYKKLVRLCYEPIEINFVVQKIV